MSKISRNADDDKLPSWANDFANNLTKETAVSKSRKKSDQSIYDQISAVMGIKKSKYPTVEAAVQDYATRTGLKQYLEQIKEATSLDKSANAKIFETLPQVKETINNIVQDCRGTLPVITILEKVKNIHKRDTNDDRIWDDENLAKYVSDAISKKKQEYPDIEQYSNNLGKIEQVNKDDIDISNMDAFNSLNPVKF